MTDSSENGDSVWKSRSLWTMMVGSVVVMLVAALIQLRYGAYEMTFVEAWNGLFNPNVILNPDALESFIFGGEEPDMSKNSLIIWNIRLPRVLVAGFVGMNLAISGAIFQAVTRNELASPFILGVSSGSGFAILLIMVGFGGMTAFLPLYAALGGALSFIILYAIAWKGGTSPVRLVLGGIIVSMVFESLQKSLFFMAQDLGTVQSAIAWTTGSMTGVDWSQFRLIVPWSVLAVILAFVGARQLNVLLLGEQTAKSLGMNVERSRFALASVAIIAAASSVAVAGVVSFVGLIVPHMVRNLVGSNYKPLILGCLFVGPALVIAADTGARLALSPIQLPVGVVTGLIGGPYFLYLMRRKKKLGDI
ncbi:MAG: FecCD family ABC transporter permease [Halobacteria archaeon]